MMSLDAAELAETRVLPRTLAGATVLQIGPALRETPRARAAVMTARALVQAGARAIVGGERGELVEELESFGGEWLPFAGATLSPARLRANTAALDQFVQTERVDIVHARTTTAARSALVAAERHGARFVTELPDRSRTGLWLSPIGLSALSRGHRVISHSMHNAQQLLSRHRLPRDRVSVIPRGIDAVFFDPANAPPERVARLRRSWGVPAGVPIVLVPGRVAPRHGQLVLVQAAQILARRGLREVTFVLVGDDRRHRRYVHKIWQQAQSAGIERRLRVVGHFADMPLAYATADFVIVPHVSPPLYGRVVAEAQAMARPVIAAAIGPLPENMLAPPDVDEDERTGWLVPPGHPVALANAIDHALALDDDAHEAVATRAQEFAEFTFAPQRAAAATLEVYAELLQAED